MMNLKLSEGNDLKALMRQLAEEELEIKTPDWFLDMFDYLINKNQIIFFLDEDYHLEGYTCFWRYGKKRFRWIKQGLMSLRSNPLNMASGSYVYIPICVCRREKAEGFLDRSVHSIKELVPDVREISYHDVSGVFIRIRMEGEKCQQVLL